VAPAVVDGKVLREEVVPHGDRACAPAEAAAEFGARRMALDLLDDRPALGLGQAVEAGDVERVEEEAERPVNG
jgi:hypothetical protein